MFDQMARRFAAAPDSLDTGLVWSHMGGAVARVAPTASAFWTRSATHDSFASGEWADRSKDESNIAAVRAVWAGVEPFTIGFDVNTESGASDQRVRATYGDNLTRMAAVKDKYDPTNLFRMNANIRPTGA